MKLLCSIFSDISTYFCCADGGWEIHHTLRHIQRVKVNIRIGCDNMSIRGSRQFYKCFTCQCFDIKEVRAYCGHLVKGYSCTCARSTLCENKVISCNCLLITINQATLKIKSMKACYYQIRYVHTS